MLNQIDEKVRKLCFRKSIFLQNSFYIYIYFNQIKICILSLQRDSKNAAKIYWPQDAASLEIGSITVSNNGVNVDSRNKNIIIRDLEISIEDTDYVSKRNYFQPSVPV